MALVYCRLAPEPLQGSTYLIWKSAFQRCATLSNKSLIYIAIIMTVNSPENIIIYCHSCVNKILCA